MDVWTNPSMLVYSKEKCLSNYTIWSATHHINPLQFLLPMFGSVQWTDIIVTQVYFGLQQIFQMTYCGRVCDLNALDLIVDWW